MALLLCLTMPAKVNAESRQPCGPDAWYELSEDGTLVISGTGEITKKFGEDKAILNIQVIFNSLPDILRQVQQK